MNQRRFQTLQYLLSTLGFWILAGDSIKTGKPLLCFQLITTEQFSRDCIAVLWSVERWVFLSYGQSLWQTKKKIKETTWFMLSDICHFGSLTKTEDKDYPLLYEVHGIVSSSLPFHVCLHLPGTCSQNSHYFVYHWYILRSQNQGRLQILYWWLAARSRVGAFSIAAPKHS